MNRRLAFNKVVSIISIPLLLIALSLYLPDVYHCHTIIAADEETLETQIQCLQMVAQYQIFLYIAAVTFGLILLFFEYYKFKHSYSKKDKQLGQ